MTPEEQAAAIERLKNAITDFGSQPKLHEKELRRLKDKWPTLYKAILEVTGLTARWHG